MGSLWKDQLMGLATSLLASFLFCVCACIWRHMKKRISRPAADGEVPTVEAELDIVIVNGDGGQIAPGNLSSDSNSGYSNDTRCTGFDHSGSLAAKGSTAGDCDHHVGKLERSRDPDGLQSSTVHSSSRQSQDKID